ncbi:hypothetical protein B0H11DRAFT_2185880 [Mycena galericulata]|nr:hypothetical protein B0H11DRAFT_2185880 [Mycena galericulata]
MFFYVPGTAPGRFKALRITFTSENHRNHKVPNINGTKNRIARTETYMVAQASAAYLLGIQKGVKKNDTQTGRRPVRRGAKQLLGPVRDPQSDHSSRKVPTHVSGRRPDDDLDVQRVGERISQSLGMFSSIFNVSVHPGGLPGDPEQGLSGSGVDNSLENAPVARIYAGSPKVARQFGPDVEIRDRLVKRLGEMQE